MRLLLFYMLLFPSLALALSVSPQNAFLYSTMTITCNGTITVTRPDTTISYDHGPAFKDTGREGIYNVRCEEYIGSNLSINTSAFEILRNTGQKPFTPNPNQSRVWDVAANGTSLDFVLDNPKIEVKRVRVDLNGSSEKVSISVSKLLDKPSIAEPKEKIYSYLQIDTANVEGNINQARIDFEVEKDWMTYNGVSKALLQRFDSKTGSWERLDTRYVSENVYNIRYTSLTQRLSLFAITEEGTAPTTTTTVTPTTTVPASGGQSGNQTQGQSQAIVESCGNGVCAAGETKKSCPADCLPKEKKQNYIIYIAIGLALALGFFFFFMK